MLGMVDQRIPSMKGVINKSLLDSIYSLVTMKDDTIEVK